MTGKMVEPAGAPLIDGAASNEASMANKNTGKDEVLSTNDGDLLIEIQVL